jgi:hypothetical protein
MQEYFEQANDAGLVDLDAGITNRGDGLEALAYGLEMLQSLLEAEIGEVVGDQLVAHPAE